MASVPNVVNLRSLKPANALISGSGTWALTFGAMIISFVLLHIGAMNLYLIACGTYFAAALILMPVNFIKVPNLKKADSA